MVVEFNMGLLLIGMIASNILMAVLLVVATANGGIPGLKVALDAWQILILAWILVVLVILMILGGEFATLWGQAASSSREVEVNWSQQTMGGS